MPSEPNDDRPLQPPARQVPGEQARRPVRQPARRPVAIAATHARAAGSTPASTPAAPAPAIGAPPPLDRIDQAIVRLLAHDARLPNSAVAEAVGIAPSTCHGRIRALVERGVIRGFHADVNPAALGLGLQAMIAVRLNAHTRDQIDAFVRDVPRLPGVVGVFHVAGADDYLLHVAVRDSDALREFVLEHLTGHPAVRHTETSLIFAHLPGAVSNLGLSG